MYRILVISDTHGSIKRACEAIETIKLFDMIVHLGDYAKDCERIKKEYPQYRYENVAGNCDTGSAAKKEKIICCCGFKLLLTHGHMHNVKFGTDKLFYYAKEKDADCVLFGHTHCACCEKTEDILFLNPGSAAGYTGGSVGIIEIENNEIKGCVV